MSEESTDSNNPAQRENILRTCANCACHFVQENQISKMLGAQSFCRRNPPTAAQLRGERPRIRDGKAVIGRDNQPVMEAVTETHYLYTPVMPSLVCFDGWRPLEALPGEKWDGIRAAALKGYVDEDALEVARRTLAHS